jgi:GDP-L-fucose synthase
VDINDSVYVAGHNGMVGSAIVRLLQKKGYSKIICASRAELDLTNQADVKHFLQQHKPDHVILAAAKVGGIHANDTYPAEFIYQNLMIQNNIIDGAFKAGCTSLLFLGSSCIYPKGAKQPMAETELLTGKLEPTNEPYAIAKIAGIKMCESYNRQYGVSYRSVMPTNLYGPGDNFHPENSHVIPAMLSRFHSAKMDDLKEVSVWGSGTPMREFLHVDDMAEACLHTLAIDRKMYESVTTEMGSNLNIGTGKDCTIRELAETMAKVVDFKGEIVFDISKPDGTPRKLLDVSRIKSLGWKYSIGLEEGLCSTYQWFLEQKGNIRRGS